MHSRATTSDRAVLGVLLLLLALCAGCAPDVQGDVSEVDHSPSRSTGIVPEPLRRQFRFVYGATLTQIEPRTEIRVWLPVPQSNHDQQITAEDIKLPTDHQETIEKRFGNKLFYFAAQANEHGEVPIEVSYRVDRIELLAHHSEPAEDSDNEMYLASSRLMPVADQLRIELLGKDSPSGTTMDIARHLYEAVDNHMRYDKPLDRPGWGRGDAVWACGNGYGNCTDFHSLFISAARNLKIPSRFEIGFMIPPRSAAGSNSGTIGGYHCWAKFLSNRFWVPVDISEADKHPDQKEYYFGNLTADRVTFTSGRDLELEPPNAAGPVNFLVYPYAEIDGRPHESFRKEFRYEALE